MKIPQKNKDLIRYVRFCDARRIVGYLLWIALLIGGALSYNHNHQTYPDYRRMVGWRMGLWVLIAIVSGFFLFRIWKFFTDRTLSGTVVSSTLSRSYTASETPGEKTDYDFRLNTALKLCTDQGKRRRIRFEQKAGFYQYYHEDSHVVRLHGLPFPVNTDPNAPHGYVCSVCGNHHKQLPDRCQCCDYSIIDPKDLQEL